MTPPNTAQSYDPTIGSGTDALSRLAEVRQSLSRGGATDAEEFANELLAELDQIVLEHQGLAQEVLSVYEQLGMVFEITRRLAGVQNEDQVISLFLESLRRSFQQREVLVAHRNNVTGWTLDQGRVVVRAWLADHIERACADRRTLVEEVSAGQLTDSVAEVMVGPVFSGDSMAFVLLLLRSRSAPPFKAAEMLLIDSLSTFCGDLIRNHRLVRELREMSIGMVRSLVSAVDQKDEYTCGHSLRVAFYATALGKLLGQSEVDLQMLQWSALLHDVGKIGIRDGVLKKEGRLTTEEFAHIKEHPVRSHRVVKEVPHLAEALDGVLHHHERFDGSGYPDGLVGEKIPLQARIIQIADIFDALTSSRSYRPAYDWKQALAILADEAGKTVDPRLQKVFEAWIRGEVGQEEGAWERIVQRAERHAESPAIEGMSPVGV